MSLSLSLGWLSCSVGVSATRLHDVTANDLADNLSKQNHSKLKTKIYKINFKFAFVSLCLSVCVCARRALSNLTGYTQNTLHDADTINIASLPSNEINISNVINAIEPTCFVGNEMKNEIISFDYIRNRNVYEFVYTFVYEL